MSLIRSLFVDPGSDKFTVKSDRSLGFSRITVQNNTHLLFEHFLSDTMAVFDSFTIYKPILPVPPPSDEER